MSRYARAASSQSNDRAVVAVSFVREMIISTMHDTTSSNRNKKQQSGIISKSLLSLLLQIYDLNIPLFLSLSFVSSAL
jgi:hypothetical protein